MTMEKPPAGTRGGRPLPGFLARVMTALMIRLHRRSGDRFQGSEVLYLSTIGARTGRPRTAPVVPVPDDDCWLICASAAGSVHHPGWYHNIVAHPDQVYAEVRGARYHVAVEQLTGSERERGWALLIHQLPRFADYAKKTDREMPLLRLTPVDR